MSFYLEQIIKQQQEHVTSMAKELDKLSKENGYLKAENKKLKSEHYKDKELKFLKKEVEAYKDTLSHSFCIWNKEDVDDWIKIHNKKHKTDEPRKYTHHYSYTFTPSPLGTTGEIKCSCGESFSFEVGREFTTFSQESP